MNMAITNSSVRNTTPMFLSLVFILFHFSDYMPISVPWQGHLRQTIVNEASKKILRCWVIQNPFHFERVGHSVSLRFKVT